MTMIIDNVICSLSKYLELKKQQLDGEWQSICGGSKSKHRLLVPERPRECQECGKVDCFGSIVTGIGGQSRVIWKRL